MRGVITLTQDEIKKLYKTIKKWNDPSVLLKYSSDKIEVLIEDLENYKTHKL